MIQAAQNIQQAKGSERFEGVSSVLSSACQEGVFPAASLQISRYGETLYQGAAGRLTQLKKAAEGEPGESLEAPSDGVPVSHETVFDIDGLTVPVVTVPIILNLVAQNALDLDARVSRYVHGFGVYEKSPVTVRQILNHTSGLSAYTPFYSELDKTGRGGKLISVATRSASQQVYTSINRSHLKAKPGSAQAFSEVGMILLGNIIETLTGTTIDKVCWREVTGPLALRNTGYIDLSLIQRGKYVPDPELIAPSEDCSWRGRVLCGEVRDENTWMMGGVSGQAGLFSNVEDLSKWSKSFFNAYHGRSGQLARELLHESLKPAEKFEDGLRGCWSTPKQTFSFDAVKASSESGETLPPLALAGRTGCALLLDPERELSVVFLSNRSYPSRSNKKIQAFYPKLFQEIWSALSL